MAPAELEGFLLDHPDVSDVCIVGIHDDYNGDIPIAFVVPSANALLRIQADAVEADRIKHALVEVRSYHTSQCPMISGRGQSLIVVTVCGSWEGSLQTAHRGCDFHRRDSQECKWQTATPFTARYGKVYLGERQTLKRENKVVISRLHSPYAIDGTGHSPKVYRVYDASNFQKLDSRICACRKLFTEIELDSEIGDPVTD